MKKMLLTSYLVALHVLVGVAIWKTDLVPITLAKLDGRSIGNQRWIAFNQRILAERTDPIVPTGSAVFLGDSISSALLVTLVDPKGANLAVGSQTTEQLGAFISKLPSVKRAGRIFLAIGTNDIGRGKTGPKEEHFQAILDQLPDVELVWSNIMPRAGWEREIAAANSLIQKLCSLRPRCVYVDTWETMAHPGGVPLADIYLDGVHPNPKGYSLWIDLLKAAGNAPPNT